MHKNTITLPHSLMYLVNMSNGVLFRLFPGKASYGQLCNMLLYSLLINHFLITKIPHMLL